MWYRYFRKSSWAIRLWRGYNLKFKANENGMGGNVFHHYSKIMMFKIWRTEGPLRMFNLSTVFSLVFIKAYFDSKTADETEKTKNENEKKESMFELNTYLNKLQLNRYGAPTNPGNSMDDFLFFIANNQAINDLGDMNAIPEFQKVSNDFMNGLDSWIGEDDRKLLAYYNAYQKSSH